MTAPILITGGAQRLGLAIAHSLLDQNMPVIITYRSEKPSVGELMQRGAIALQADFASAQGVDDCIEKVFSHTKQLRAIVHNASDWDQESDNTNSHELFQKMMQVHANAPYRINLALKELLISDDGFTDIIHMTDYVQEKGSKKHIAYAASKAALHNLTLSFSSLLAPHVKVNSIAPALVMFNEHDSEQYKQKALKKSLLENCPGAQEAVKAVNFLLDSDYITGQTLHLNGGRHLK
ncbi:dihydromonapterin reductase [Glaciecola sp. XM2]|jgi:dihydromonapterin reductase/dihydrofolate reductase|uniref:dihydromonapterin reductase n=1 Tax=Glaciecola sp. XM2 TaxID=1914931 RepID=UPI001BDE3E28|nr:dihydromonapterin reductase [Glaciecola sp. XM2]MBT1451193.1 dihydromonapterin reductase [Glaciecola sp. XM2]